MSVVDLAGKTVTQVTPSERASDAREALRALLSRLDSGEVQAETWLFIYEAISPNKPNLVASRNLDSGLTLAQTVYMMENLKFDIMTNARAVP